MKEYDVIIIGAGIGGLVCGSYLSKSGLKVIIVEQHDKPGGYCTSFQRDNFQFDVGVHYLGGIKKRALGKILQELELDNATMFKQFDPSDKIVFPDSETYIRANPLHTIHEFKKSFPNEKTNIEKFIKFILQKEFFNIYKKCSNINFKTLLDEYFQDFRLKRTFESLLYNIGISAEKASALAATILYRDYLLDPGYYPVGGMQKFANTLANKFKEYGGNLLLKNRVKNILVKNNKVKGVVLENGEKILSNFIVSNADAHLVFEHLLKNCSCRERNKINDLIISPSLFVLYVGIKEDLKNVTEETCNIWKFSSYDLHNYFSDLDKNLLKPELPFIMVSFPSAHDGLGNNVSRNTVQFFLYAPYKSEKFWKDYKEILARKIIECTQSLFHNLKNCIELREIATPIDFHKYTLNKKGSAYGWASTVEQIRHSVFPQKTSVENLYLAGHWCTTGGGQGGIPKVVFSGKLASQLILQKFKNNLN